MFSIDRETYGRPTDCTGLIRIEGIIYLSSNMAKWQKRDESILHWLQIFDALGDRKGVPCQTVVRQHHRFRGSYCARLLRKTEVLAKLTFYILRYLNRKLKKYVINLYSVLHRPKRGLF